VDRCAPLFFEKGIAEHLLPRGRVSEALGVGASLHSRSNRKIGGTDPGRPTAICRTTLAAERLFALAGSQILEFDRMINAWHRWSETSKRLDEIPGASWLAKLR
jgi:hypothetical protein